MRHLNLTIPAMTLIAASLTLAPGLPLLAAGQDQRIEAAAEDSYNFKTYLKNDTIHVASEAGVVTLTGTVAQEDHRALAQETVAGLPGVKKVDNRLTLAANQPADRTDDWVTMKVKGALAFHKNVSATDTKVTTQDGVVTLAGNTESEAKKDLTGRYALDVEGVKSVNNELVVAGAKAHEGIGEKVDDASITAQIKTSLLFRKSTHALSTQVATRQGVVTLHGEARNAAERDLVTKIAEDIKGVKQVRNRMTLRQS
jgi:osmotically-inducible protein OsmY